MPRIENLEDVGYRIIPPIKDEVNHELVYISPDQNKGIIQDFKIQKVIKDGNEKSYFHYKEEKILFKKPSEIDRTTIEKIVDNQNKPFTPSFDIEKVVENMNIGFKQEFFIDMVVPDQNLDKRYFTQIEKVVPDTNPNRNYPTSIEKVVPDTNPNRNYPTSIEKVVPDTNPNRNYPTSIEKVVPDQNLEKTYSTDLEMVSPNLHVNESTHHAVENVMPNINTNTYIPGGMAYIFPNVGKNLQESIEYNKIAPNQHNSDLLAAGVAFIKENENSRNVDTNIGITKIANNVNPNFENLYYKDEFNNENLLKNAYDSIKDLVKDIGAAPKFLLDNFKQRVMDAYEEIKRNPLAILKLYPDTLTDVFYGSAKDTYNMIEKSYGDVAQKLNEIQGFIENIPFLDTFLGNVPSNPVYEKDVPIFKSMPAFPSKEEMMNMVKGLIKKIQQKAQKTAEAATEVASTIASGGGVSSGGSKWGYLPDPNRDDLVEHNWYSKSSKDPYNDQIMPLTYKHTKEIAMYATDNRYGFESFAVSDILDKDGMPIKDNRSIGKIYRIYNGFRESPWTGIKDNIFKDSVGFEGVPDVWCDIRITPHEYTVNKNGKITYFPPPYPASYLGGYMVNNFEVRDIQMTTEEAWNLGPYGTVPLGATMVLPSNLSITFAADASLFTHKWILAVMEYMFGSKFTVHAMRPYKMCCYDITIYATTFYGETLYARTYIAYPLFNFSMNMLGTGSIKMFETDWVIVGMKDYEKESVKQFSLTTGSIPDDIKPITADKGSLLYEHDEKLSSQTDTYTDKKISAVAKIQKFQKKATEIIKKSNKLKDNPLVQKALTKYGIKDQVDKAFKITNTGVDLVNGGDVQAVITLVAEELVKDEGKFLVCSYSNILAEPYDGTSFFTANDKRFAINDKLSEERALDLLNSMKKKGIKPENIKVVIGSMDGIPGMDEYLKVEGYTSQNIPAKDSFFLGGIYNYENPAEIDKLKSPSNADNLDEGIRVNRRSTMVSFDEMMESNKNIFKYLAGNEISDELSTWKRIPVFSYGREFGAESGHSCTVYTNSVPSKPDGSGKYLYRGAEIIQSLKSETTDTNTTTAKKSPRNRNFSVSELSTVERTYEERQKNAEQSLYMIDQEMDATGATEKLKQLYAKELNIIEKYKENTTLKTKETAIYKTYELEKVLTYTEVYNRSLTWWRTNFGSNKYKIDNKIANTQEEVENEQWTLSFPQNAKTKKKIPCIKIDIYLDELIKEDLALQYTLNTYFLKRTVAWIYNIYTDTLTLYQKKDI